MKPLITSIKEVKVLIHSQDQQQRALSPRAELKLISSITGGTGWNPPEALDAPAMAVRALAQDSPQGNPHSLYRPTGTGNRQGTSQNRKMTRSYSGNLYKTWFDCSERAPDLHQLPLTRQSSQKVVLTLPGTWFSKVLRGACLWGNGISEKI